MKICILRLSAIGDCINAISTVRMLQKKYPDAQITWVAGPASVSLLKPFLPEIIFVPYEKKGLKSIFALKKLLKHEVFDYLLMMQYAFSASLASLAIKAHLKIGFDNARSRDLQTLFCSSKIKNFGGRHMVDAFADFARAVFLKDDNKSLGLGTEIQEFETIKPYWNIKIPLEFDKKARELLNVDDRKICFINPCTSKKSKDWDLDCCCDVINYLSTKGFRSVLLGGNSSREQNCEKYIIEKCPQIFSLVGKTTLSECMACVSLGDLMISADTATVHMANALGIPVIGLYATHDPKRVGPYLDLNYSVSVYDDLIKEEYHVLPENLPWRTRVHTPEAMKRISSDMIKSKIDLFCSNQR